MGYTIPQRFLKKLSMLLMNIISLSFSFMKRYHLLKLLKIFIPYLLTISIKMISDLESYSQRLNRQLLKSITMKRF